MPTALVLPVVLALAPSLGTAAPSPPSAGQAWELLSQCGGHRSRVQDEGMAAWEGAVACDGAARVVLRLGDEGDRDRLWDLYDALPDSELLRSLLLPTLVESHVADAARTLDDAPPLPPTRPIPNSELPRELANASAELKNAVYLFEDLWSRSWPESPVPESERIPYFSAEGRGQFDRAVADYLRGRTGGAETLRALERFEYEGGCGNGASAFFVSVSAVRLIASIRDGRVDADAAVAYVVGGSRPPHQLMAGADRRLLAAAGIDWEQLYLGAFLSRHPQHLAPLMRGGSDLTARLLLEFVGLGEADFVRHLLTPSLSVFVTPAGPCDGYATVSSEDAARDPDAPPIDPQIQETILEMLAKGVLPGAGLDEAANASHALLRLCRGESRDAFRAMLRSPYSQVRTRGAVALRALGEEVVDPPPSAPVAFRLLVDGRPWHAPVLAELVGPEVDRSSGEAGDRDGVVHLERDPFLDPTAPVETVRLSAPDLTSPQDAWFSLHFKRPSDLDQRTLLTVRTGALVVVVPTFVRLGPTGGRQPVLTLLTGDPAAVPGSFTTSITTGLPARAGRYVFPHLQQRRYKAQVTQPDGTVLESPEVDVGERPLTVELQPVIADDEAEVREELNPDP